MQNIALQHCIFLSLGKRLTCIEFPYQYLVRDVPNQKTLHPNTRTHRNRRILLLHNLLRSNPFQPIHKIKYTSRILRPVPNKSKQVANLLLSSELVSHLFFSRTDRDIEQQGKLYESQCNPTRIIHLGRTRNPSLRPLFRPHRASSQTIILSSYSARACSS